MITISSFSAHIPLKNSARSTSPTAFNSFFSNALDKELGSMATGTTIPDGYQLFRDTVLGMDEIPVPKEYYYYDTKGDENLTDEGKEFIKKFRVDNAACLAPGSIEEASCSYTRKYEELQRALDAFIKDSGFHVSIALDSGRINNYNNYGMFSISDPAQTKSFMDYLRSDQGRAINVLAEETAFYGAIVSLADKNPEFRREYDADAKAALDKFYSLIADELSITKLPCSQSQLGAGLTNGQVFSRYDTNTTGRPYGVAPHMELLPMQNERDREYPWYGLYPSLR